MLPLSSTDLRPGSDGKIIIILAEGQSELVIPQELAKDIEDDIEVDVNGLFVQVPASVLKSLIPAGNDGGGNVILKFRKLSAEAANKVQAGIVHEKYESISLVGDVYDFEIAYVSRQNESTTMQLNGPVMVKFPTQGGSDTAQVGIYYIDDKGRIAYIRGKRVGSYVEAQLQHFSKYALLNVQVSFNDVPSSYWAYEAITELAGRQLLQSEDGAVFMPNKNVSRGEFAEVIAKAIGLNAKQASAFADVDSNSEAASYIEAAYESGLVLGMNGREFRPEASLTREQLAVVMMRASLLLAPDAAISMDRSVYKDWDHIATWATDAVDFGTAKGFYQGRGGQIFAPSDMVSRAEMALVVQRFLNWAESL